MTKTIINKLFYIPIHPTECYYYQNRLLARYKTKNEPIPEKSNFSVPARTIFSLKMRGRLT